MSTRQGLSMKDNVPWRSKKHTGSRLPYFFMLLMLLCFIPPLWSQGTTRPTTGESSESAATLPSERGFRHQEEANALPCFLFWVSALILAAFIGGIAGYRSPLSYSALLIATAPL